jgi:hypothetical protein
MSVGELAFVKVGNGHAHMLLFATGIGKTKIHELDIVFFHHFEHISDGLGHQFLLSVGGWLKIATKPYAETVPSQHLWPHSRTVNFALRLLPNGDLFAQLTLIW